MRRPSQAPGPSIRRHPPLSLDGVRTRRAVPRRPAVLRPCVHSWWGKAPDQLFRGKQVILHANLFDQLELGFQPVNVFFFGLKDGVKQVAGHIVLA